MSASSAKSSSSGKGGDEDAGHHFAERANSLEQVRKKLRSGWRNDDGVLNQYFQSCFTNWKIYKGKRTPQQVLKLQAIYKQAIYGDNPDPPPGRADSTEGLKWIAWRKLSGTPKAMAKRRFITFLAEIDPVLIDVMPDEKPPIGFPLDRKGTPVCAKCNTKVGCLRPLLDQNKTNLKQQLFENEELQIPKKFQEWVRNALANQRCIWGVHKAISRAEAKPFTGWFEKDENRGFYPYDSISLMLMIHEFIHHHHEVCYDMMLNKTVVDALDYNAQVIKTMKLKEVYEQLAGEEFVFYIPCERENDMCNQRRAADGGRNHTHAQEIDPPSSTNMNSLEEAVELRKQCMKLGINPCTGVVADIAQRCEIYRDRIAKHFEALQAAAVAKARNEKRHAVHAAEKAKVKELSKNMLAKQCWEVCQLNLVDSVLQIVHRGCNPNEESPRGLTPLSTLVMNDAQIEKVEELLALKANINLVNRFGLSPLMLACRMSNNKMVHILMRSGASALQKDEKVGRTALHWCVVHGCDEMVKIICEYLKEGVGDSMRVTRFLDAQTLDGETALMLAAQRRNGIMCYALTSIGANPNMRNNKGRTAAYLARQKNWGEIADWLEKKVGAGMAKVETFSDLQFEKQHRFGLIKIKDLMHHFGRTYLLLMQNRIGLHPLGCPYVAKSNVAERGERAITEQRKFMDNHQLHILKRDLVEYQTGKKTAEGDGEDDKREHQHLKEMKGHVVQMLELLRAGVTNPNTELEPKPLAWTPLMCAVAVSDIRSIKLMIREGADPNHPNRDGTTAVMLAAQLQNVEALTELLIHKGDVEAVDSQGYNVSSYATSLPLPSVMDRDVVGVIMEGDTDGPRPMTSMELLKIVMLGGLQDLRSVMAEREAAGRPEALDTHFKVMQLLEKYGLTTLQTERNVHDSVRSSAWRVKEPELFQQKIDLEKEELERERRNKMLYERIKNKGPPPKTADELSLEDLRCPVCTLQVPCAHFFKIEILKQFLQKKIEAAKLAAAGELAEVADGTKRPRRKFLSAKKLRIANRVQEILTEAHLADRNTDRSILLVQQYRGREIEVAEEKAKKERLLIEAATRQAEEEEMARLEAEGGEDAEVEYEDYEENEETAGEEQKEQPLLEDVGFEHDDEASFKVAVGAQKLIGMEVSEEAANESKEDLPLTEVGVLGLPQPQGVSKLRGIKRLPSKQDLSSVDDGSSRLSDVLSQEAATDVDGTVNALVPALESAEGDSTEASTALVVVPLEEGSADAVVTELALVVAPSTDLVVVAEEGTDSQALVVVPPPEESMALVPSLKSALKMVIAEAEGSTAVVEFKKKRRVKFYFAEDQRQHGETPPLAITDGADGSLFESSNASSLIEQQQLVIQGGEGAGEYGELMISEDASLSSGSTASSVDGVPASLLITSAKAVGGSVKVAKSPGIAIADSGSEFPAATMATRIAAGVNANAAASNEVGLFDDIETVSTTTTLTSAEGAPPSPHRHALSAHEAHEAQVSENAHAGLSRLQDGELPEYLKASALVNPVPLHNRRVFMFTRNSMDRHGRTDGLVHIPSTHAQAQTQSTDLVLADDATKPILHPKPSSVVTSGGGDAAAAGSAMPPSGKKKIKKGHVIKKQQAPPRLVIVSAPIKVEVSGWIFVSLADIQSEVNPLDNVSIALESWGGMLEIVRETLFDEWLPDLRLEPVISVKTWQPIAPRCSVCSVGYVRFRSTIESFQQHPLAYINLYGSQNISSSSENTHHTHLCLACAVRKELFLQSQKFFPESALRADQRVAWPFMHRKNVKESTMPPPTFSFLSAPHAPSSMDPAVMAATAGHHNNDLGVHVGEDAFNENPPEGERLVIPHTLDAGGSADSISAMSWTTGLTSGLALSDHLHQLQLHQQYQQYGQQQQQALVLLPPTSLQTAQSNSPVKSQRLQDLDTREMWDRQMNPHYGTSLFDQDSDMSSIQSTGSMISGVTDSVEQRHQRLGGDDAASLSVASSVSAVNPTKKPKELALLPYLIAKGHYEEAERTLRIALSKRAVDEGEGLKVLISLLTLQAEMYKSMGLWPLALAIYFDCVDMNASLMGYNDSATLASIVLLVSCLRKMQCVTLAGKYVKGLCQMVQQETMKSMKMEIIEKIKKQDSAQVKEFLSHNAIWTELLKPHVVAHNPLQRRFQSVVGMGGFYSLLTAQDGFSVVARIGFYTFCEEADKKTLGVFAQFVDFCFRLRLCDEPQMYKYLVQHVTQKQLAKALVAESEVARLYRTVTNKQHIDLVIDFLNYGVQPSVAVFDAMLKLALEKLLPVYRIFLLFEPAGSMLREQRVDIIAEAYDVSALIIQTATRRRQARKRVEVVRAESNAKEKKRLDILMLRKRKAARY